MARHALRPRWRPAGVMVVIGVAVALGGCTTPSPKQTVLNLDSTDRKWTSRKCVQARKAAFEFNEYNRTRTIVKTAGNIALPFAGTASTYAWSKTQDDEREALNARIEKECVTKKKVKATKASAPKKSKGKGKAAKKRRS